MRQGTLGTRERTIGLRAGGLRAGGLRAGGLALVAAIAAAACGEVDGTFADAAPGGDGFDGQVDDAPPTTTITSAPPMYDASAAATFAFEANEPATFACSVDDEAPEPCTSPYTRTLADGPHTFRVRATDLAGNVEEMAAEHVWQIDTVAPDTTITTAPPAVDNSTAGAFEFSADESPATFECRFDGGTFAACTTPHAYDLGAGSHTFQVRATDVAGNVDPTPATHTWTIDTSTPDTTIDSGPTGAVASTSATFTFSSNAGAGATYECGLDGAAFAACTSPRSYSGLAQGAHEFRVRVRNAAGTYDPTPATRTWTVDTVPPDTTITSGPSGAVASTSATFTFSSNEAGATFQCRLDGGTFAACPATHQLTGLSQGAHTLEVRARDVAGNVDPTPASRTWTVDTAGPVITFNQGPANGSTSGPYVTFAWTVNEPATLTCTLDGQPVTPCTSPRSFSLPAAGHTFAVSGVDALGNPGSASRTWTVACPAPGLLPGAVGQFAFEETSGQTYANAVAGGANAVAGTSLNAETADPDFVAGGRYGRGLGFITDAGDVVTWSTGVVSTGEFTVEVWVRPTQRTYEQEIVNGLAVNGVPSFRVFQAPSNAGARFIFRIIDGAGVARDISSGAYAYNAWHHVVVTLRGSEMTLWVDGDPVTGAVSVPNGVLTRTLTLGRIVTSLLSPNALMDHWSFGTTALTQTQVLNRYCPL